MQNPPSLSSLIEALRCLPGVGPKSAQRMAFHLLQRDREGAQKLASTLNEVLSRVGHCEWCNTFSEEPVCPLCRSEKRDSTQLCVVEMPADLLMMEQARCFQGLYFVLMGRLSPLDGLGPKDIAIEKLITRALDGKVAEVILATNYTVEGEATAHYLATQLQTKGLKVSRIARGLPVGGELEYIDSGTLAQAFYERRASN